MPAGAVDCGNGRRYCNEGLICGRGDACLTPEQAVEQRQEEERQRAERRRLEQERQAALRAQREYEAAQRRQAAEQRKEAARLKEQERQAEIANRKAEAETRRQAAIDAKKQAAEARRLAAEADAKKKADTDFDQQLRAIVNNPKESLTQRKIAAIALGIDPSIFGPGNKSTIAQLKTSVPNHAEREIAKLALGKVKGAPAAGATSLDDLMRTIMNDPKETPAARQIAAIGLGIDPASLGLTKTSTPSGTPTKTPADTSLLGKIIAKLYPPSKLPTSTPSGPSNITVIRLATTGFFPGSATSPKQTPNLWTVITNANNAMLQSRQGQVLVDTLAAAGGAVAKNQYPGLSHIGDIKDLLSAVDAIRRGDAIGGLQVVADKAAVDSAGGIGGLLTPENPSVGSSIAAGGTQYVLTTWKLYGAPVVGDELVKLFPGTFIPASPNGP